MLAIYYFLFIDHREYTSVNYRELQHGALDHLWPEPLSKGCGTSE